MLLGGKADGIEAVQHKIAAALQDQGVSGQAAGDLAGGWVKSFVEAIGASGSPEESLAQAGRVMNATAARMAEAVADAAPSTAEQRLMTVLTQGPGASGQQTGAAPLDKALFDGVMDQLSRPAGSSDPLAALSQALNDAPARPPAADLSALSPAEKLAQALASGGAVPQAIEALGPNASADFIGDFERALSSGADVASSIATAAARTAQAESQARTAVVETSGGDRLLTALASGQANAVQAIGGGDGAFVGTLNDALARGAAPDGALDASAKAQAGMAALVEGAAAAPKPGDALTAALSSGRDVAATVKSFTAAAGVDPAVAGDFGRVLASALSSGSDAAHALGAAQQNAATVASVLTSAAQGVKSDPLMAALASGENVQATVQAFGGEGAFGAALGQALASGQSIGQAMAAAKQVAATAQKNADQTAVPVSAENKALADLATPKAADGPAPDAAKEQVAEAAGGKDAAKEGPAKEDAPKDEAAKEEAPKDAAADGDAKGKEGAADGEAAGDKAEGGEAPAADAPAPGKADAAKMVDMAAFLSAGGKSGALAAGGAQGPSSPVSAGSVTASSGKPAAETLRLPGNLVQSIGQVVTPVEVRSPAPVTVPDFDAAAFARAMAVAEGTTAPAGFTVFHLIEAMFRPGKADGTIVGLAVVANPGSPVGVWQYSVDGSDWQAVGPVADGAALVLPGRALLRFLPADDMSGDAPALGLRALNESWTGGFSGAGRTLFALTEVGGTSPVSADVVSLPLLVTPVNDAPVATGTAATLAVIAEDTANPAGATVASLFAALFSDAADAVAEGSSANQLAGVAIVGNAATAGQGVWQYWNGTDWSAVGAVSEGAALLVGADTSLRFVPAAGWNGTVPALTVRLVDDSAGAIVTGARVGLAAGVGGSTPYSAGTVALGQTVIAVNDAPVATGNVVTLEAIAEDAANPAGATVSSLFAALFSDAADAVPGGSSSDALAGVVIVGNAATAGQGVWQYWDGAGWRSVGAVSESAALIVASADKLRFVPSADWNGAVPALTVRLVDGSGGAVTSGTVVDLTATGVGGTAPYSTGTIALNQTVTAVNDAPVATGSVATLAAIAEDTANPAGATVLSLFAALFSDAADAVAGGSSSDALAGIAIVGNAATSEQGVWQYWNGTGWTAVGAVSEGSALLVGVDTSLRFVPAANWNGAVPALTVRLVDASAGTIVSGSRVSLATGVGGATAYSAGTIALSQTVVAVNDAPIATGTVATLAAIAEDTVNPAGATVASLFGALFSDAVDAVAGGSSSNALAGIAIVGNAATAGQGVWQYWNGTGWSTVGAVSDGAALIVAAADKLRFVPAPDWNGAVPALTVRLVDGSGGGLTSGAVINLAATGVGGATPYSVAAITLNSSVVSVNDAPVATGGAATLAAITEDTANPAGASVASLFGALFSDAADAVAGGSSSNALAGVAIVGNTATAGQGVWQYWNGTSWQSVSAVSDGAALLVASTGKLRFVPAPDWNGTVPALTVRLVDGSGGGLTSGTVIDLTAAGVGGATSYSAGTIALSQTVAAVNDAPVATGSAATLAAIAEDSANPAGATVLSLFAALFSDAADAVAGGSSSNALAGIAVVGNAATAGQGVWQYWNGTGWSTIGAVSDGAALIVASADKLRFVPASNWNGTVPALTVRLVDGSGGGLTSGAVVDLNAAGVGGATAYSAGTIAVAQEVTPVNDAPEIAVGTPALTTVKGVAVAVTGLSVSDVDAGSTPILVTLTAGHGTLTLAGGGTDAVITGNGTGTVTVRATVATINALLAATDGLRYTATSYTGADAVTVLVDDQGGGGAGGALTATAAIAVTVVPPNASPVLVDTNLSISTVAAASAAPTAGTAGIAVSKLVGLNGTGPANVTDSDGGAVTGIALVGTNETYGHWWFSTDGGAHWALVGAVSDASALLLRPTDRLYFQPNAAVPETVSGALTIRAWDQTTGAYGTKDAVDTGAGSAFSGQTDTVTLHPAVLVANGSFDNGLNGWLSTGGASVAAGGDGHQGQLTSSAGQTAGQLESYLGLSAGSIAAATGTIPSYGHAMKLGSTITVTQDTTLTFDWSFAFSDFGYYDFGFVAVNGVVTLLAKAASASGTFRVVIPANTTLSLGFGVSDTSDNSVNPILTVDNIRLTTVASDPIVLDMTGHGLSLRPLSDGVLFDVTGDGVADQTGWIGSGTALLARDTNHDGRIDGAHELVSEKFGTGFNSSLDALASLDSNHDGRLDAADADYATLLVWQDADADGVSRPGELKTLAEAGIASIATTATAGGGSVAGNQVLGTTSMTMADGSQHQVAGVSFDVKAGTGAVVQSHAATPDAPDFAAMLREGLGAPHAAQAPQDHAGAEASPWIADGIADTHDPTPHPHHPDNPQVANLTH